MIEDHLPGGSESPKDTPSRDLPRDYSETQLAEFLSDEAERHRRRTEELNRNSSWIDKIFDRLFGTER